MALNHCRGSGIFVGLSYRLNKAKCPTCGKRVTVTKDGRLWPHGTRRKTREQRIAEDPFYGVNGPDRSDRMEA